MVSKKPFLTNFAIYAINQSSDILKNAITTKNKITTIANKTQIALDHDFDTQLKIANPADIPIAKINICTTFIVSGHILNVIPASNHL